MRYKIYDFNINIIIEVFGSSEIGNVNRHLASGGTILHSVSGKTECKESEMGKRR
jgi:hypothetical protein